MDPSDRQQAIKRLHYIAGHLEGIRRMIEEEKDCGDIIEQTYAVRCAIEKMETLLLGQHLRSCVVERLREGQEEQVVSELLELYELAGMRRGGGRSHDETTSMVPTRTRP